MTESTTSSPHDAVFKTFMFTPETAVSVNGAPY